jgi:hypothetical protein
VFGASSASTGPTMTIQPVRPGLDLVNPGLV